MQTTLSPLIAIVGPTAVGKTALSIELGHTLNAEIISADSRLIYQGMDIGTAKPTLTERQGIPHHLIDVIPPDQEYSLALFQQQAYMAVDDVLARGKLPLIVGGTGQYMAAVLEGWSIPQVAPQPALRAELEAFAQNHGAPALHARLAEVDPQAAVAIEPNNVRRIIRGLEVWTVTGEPISKLQERKPPPYKIRTIYLDRPREELYQRIDQRVETMIHQGLIAEVLGLIAAGYHWDLPAMSSLGYAEWRPLWEGTATAQACMTTLMFNTHRFARKQGAWFRRLPNVHTIQASQDSTWQQIQAVVAELVHEKQ